MADYTILATEESADERLHVLKLGDTFALLDRHGDIRPGGLGQLGLYSGGTRRLSRLELGIAGHRPMLLSSTVTRDNAVSVADLTNPDVLDEGGERLRNDVLHLHRSTVVADDALHSEVRLRSYALEPVGVFLDVLFDADFADVFEVRGSRRARRGRRAPAAIGERDVSFAYRGLDGVERVTRLAFDPPPQELTASRARWRVHLEAGAETTVAIAVSCGTSHRSLDAHADVRARTSASLRERAAPLDRIRTTHEPLDACLRRGASDLAMLLSPTSNGLYPHAGVPWFSTPFGRDGLITALELLWLHPAIAAGVLRYLAATQATAVDPARDAEPGKILHETRSGEMAALGEVPFGLYYGSVDATPLFVLLAGAYFRRTGDRRLVESLWPSIVAALEWIDRYGDEDRDGLVEYARRSERGLRHQGWKDSSDCVFDASGRLVDGPIALAEVQAYVYGARREGARLAALLGDGERARRLEHQAEQLRARFEDAFWCEELGTYALALAGDKQQCRVRTSNAGHCLLTGLARADRAERVAEGLLAGDLFSGWGIRTLSMHERRYNPLAYHNGTVWPHDNAVIAAGFARYGLTNAAATVFEAMLDAASWMPLERLPELFCGFPRRGGQGPTHYPVACAPQAWAAGAPYLLLAAALGLDVIGTEQRVILRRPRLPAAIDRVLVELEIGEDSVRLDVRQEDGEIVVAPETSGAIEVTVEP